MKLTQLTCLLGMPMVGGTTVVNGAGEIQMLPEVKPEPDAPDVGEQTTRPNRKQRRSK